MSYMEFEAVIPEGGWSSLGHEMCTSDEESEFMSQLLANCSVANDMNEASSSAIPFAICPSHEYSPTNMTGIDQVSHYSSEIANLYFSNGSSTYSFANNQNYYTNESNQIMPRNFCNFESFCHWNANDTNLFLNQGEEYGIAHLELSNGNVEEYSGKNQPGGAIYEQILQLNRTMESEVTVSENSNKRPCSSVEVQKKKRNVKPKKGKKPVLTIDIEDNDASCKGQSSSSCSGDGDSNASQQDLSGGVSPSSSSPKGLADLNLNCKTKASRGSATDSQSIYARKRREKINSRLQILQNLVPNGTKVDISTMLEEAVQYVKFLQLQIKLLSSEDMWMYAPIAYNGIDIGMDLNS